jgi:hypothetical protein
MKWHPLLKTLGVARLFSDTSDFGNVDYGDIIYIDKRYFLIARYTREGRFGLEEQPKQWVPNVYVLVNGQRNI